MSGPINTSTNPHSAPDQEQIQRVADIIDTYIRPFIHQGAIIRYDPLPELLFCQSTKQIQQFKPSLKGLYYCIFLNKNTSNMKTMRFFNSTVIDVGDSNIALICHGPIFIDKIEYQYIVMLSENDQLIYLLDQHFHFNPKHCTFSPQDVWDQNLYIAHPGKKLKAQHKTEKYLLQVTSGQVFDLLTNKAYPLSIRVCSIIRSLMGSCIPLSGKKYYYMQYKTRSAVGTVTPQRRGADMLVAYSIAFFGPAYSDIGRTPGQLQARLKAALAGGSWETPSTATISAAIQDAGWSRDELTADVSEMIGWAICIDKKGVFSSYVTTLSILDPSDYIVKYGQPDLARRLLIQARMIYQGYQAKSIGFGAMVLDQVKIYFESLGGSWMIEYAQMAILAPIIAQAPYTGCVLEIPTAHQVSGLARISYIGLAYYAKYLSDPAEIKNFKKYKIKAIKKHIANDMDRRTADRIVDLLPSPTVVTLAKFLGFMPLAQSQALMERKSSEETLQVYNYMKFTDSSGAWYMEQKQLKEDQLRMNIKKEILQVIESKFNSTKTILGLLAKASAITDPAESLKLAQSTAKFRTDYLNKMSSLANLIPPAAIGEDLSSREKELADYKSLYETVIKGSLDNSDIGKPKLIITEQIGSILTIGINRPEKRNCINSSTASALLKAFQDFDNDESSKVAVLYGVGGNFCAGYDLEEVSKSPQVMSTLSEDRGPMGPTRYETSKPVIAAVDGYAVAGGLELALWCDIRIMEETAVMGVFCRRFGVPLIDGGTFRLPQMVGIGRALDIILTGRPVRAPEALQIGLANQVVSCGCALGRAVFQAEALIKYPQEALRADRYSARRAASFTSIKEALVHEHRVGLKALVEAKEGATNFVQGRGRHGSFKDDFALTEKENNTKV